MVVATGDSTAVTFSLGSDGQILSTDSSTETGLK